MEVGERLELACKKVGLETPQDDVASFAVAETIGCSQLLVPALSRRIVQECQGSLVRRT